MPARGRSLGGVQGEELFLERVHPPDGADRVVREHDHHPHLQDELEQVHHQDAPEPRQGRDHRRDRHDAEDHHQGLELRHPEDHHQDLHHRQVDPAHDDAVDRQTEVERPEPAQEGGRRPAVADLGELDVGQDAGAPPQPGVEEDREHAARNKIPPQPIAGDAALGHHAGDRQRRVGGEGRGDHRRTGQPPRDVAPGEEEFVDARSGSGLVIEADGQVEKEVQANDGPVEESELHSGGIIQGSADRM